MIKEKSDLYDLFTDLTACYSDISMISITGCLDERVINVIISELSS